LVGVLLLLSNLGLLQGVNIWNLIWPLFLIALGLWFLWGTFFRRAPEVEYASVPLEGAQRARVRLSHGAGRLDIASGAGMNNLVEGDFGGGIDLDSRRNGDALDASLRVPVQVFPFSWWPGSTLDWNVRLNREVPLTLEVEGGANDTRIDLRDVRVNDLTLKSGASSTNLTLPARAGMTRARVSSGAASINIAVPEGVAARIRWRGGLSTVNVNQARFQRLGDTYQSPDYDSAANKVDLDVEMGVGSVTVN
jgi:hypothetical protein